MKQVSKKPVVRLAMIAACALAMAMLIISPSSVFAAAATPEVEIETDIETDAEVDAIGDLDNIPPPNTTTVTITQETHFSFTPNATGYWTFVTSDTDNPYSPRLTVTNHYGHVLATDSGTAPGGNAIVKVHMVEGAPYVIHAGSSWGPVGTYTLTVFMSEAFERPTRPVPIPIEIPGTGGFVRGHDRLFYSFTPETSGFWLFDAASTGMYVDIEIQDNRRNFVAGTLDGWASEFSATVRLVAGVEYIIRGWSDWDGTYTLEVSPTDTFVPWIDWDSLAAWGLTIDLDADREALPSYGGEAQVSQETHLSFMPDTTGPWTFSIENSTDDAIVLITDTYGSFIIPVEGSRWWNDWTTVELEADIEYVIWASSQWSNNFSFTLVVEPYQPWTPDWDWDIDWNRNSNSGRDIDWEYIVDTFYFYDGDYDWNYDWNNDHNWNDDYDWNITRDWRTRIPTDGGYILVDNESWFVFSPEETSSWSIQLLAPGGNWNDLSITDASGSFTLHTSGAVISLHMAGGHDYTIEAWAGWDATTTVLLVSPTYEILVPHGHAMRRIMRETEFAFVPTQTGYWLIYTSQAASATDPYLWLLDTDGNILALDDDGGEGLNALIKIRLEEGQEYIIRAGFFAGAGEYLLNVRMAGSEQNLPELVVLTPPAL